VAIGIGIFEMLHILVEVSKLLDRVATAPGDSAFTYPITA